MNILFHADDPLTAFSASHESRRIRNWHCSVYQRISWYLVLSLMRIMSRNRID